MGSQSDHGISVFRGPMAVVIGGGLLGTMVLTLLVLPALYSAFCKVELEY